MTTTTPSDGTPMRGSLDWRDATLESFPPIDKRKRNLSLVLTATMTLIDIALLYSALAGVLTDLEDWNVRVLAFALGVAVLYTMRTAGDLARGARGNEGNSRWSLTFPVALVITWFLLGIGIAVLRALGDTATDDATVYADAGAIITPPPDHTGTVVVVAVFFCVYLLAGILAFSETYRARNDARDAGSAAQATVARLREELAREENEFTQAELDLATRRQRIAALDRAADAARAGNAALEAELQQLVRTEMLTSWGDPLRSGIGSPRHPDNPLSDAPPPLTLPHAVHGTGDDESFGIVVGA